MEKSYPTTGKALIVERLCKSYKDTKALSGVSFIAKRGELLGYLGPNGAGKTTTINILSGLLEPDSGRAEVYRIDVAADPIGVKQRLGVVPEESNLYPELTCRNNLIYAGELYGLSKSERMSRADDLLHQFGLIDRSGKPFRSLSRGLKRRLTIAAALVHSPDVLFLDEPTAGLDVVSAMKLRSLIRDINGAGTTVLLTTHNLREASDLCTRILILIGGRIVAEGTPSEISARVSSIKRLSVGLSQQLDLSDIREACKAIKSASIDGNELKVDVLDVHDAIAQIMTYVELRGGRILSIESVAPSLEDAFISILEQHGEDGN
ncbi:MAG: ABC transporter ATP-binding protein [Candidatus Coatesbacteria bacterium]|nr:ABC transporter ATP-binding protein [Candidatus Coatesbacteria bacterium]